MASDACLKLAPVITTNYTPKGSFTEISGLKTYITGDISSNRGIIDVYDVFGIVSQTQQGADRLAATLKAVVLMPDFFEGQPLPLDAIPPDTEEKKKIVADFKTRRELPKNVKKLIEVATEAKKLYPSVGGWGSIGLCWGGKICAITSGVDTPFKVSAQVHPGALEKEDAEKMTIPHICLASNGEPVDVVKDYAAVLSGEGHTGVVEYYATMHHGWMGARANLDNEENAKEYERGYNQVAEFFAKYI